MRSLRLQCKLNWPRELRSCAIALLDFLIHILLRWREWASPEESKQWVEQLVSSKDGLLCFLKGFVQEGSASGAEDYAARVISVYEPQKR